MDSELRRRFLQMLGFDFAALDLREARVPRSCGDHNWPVTGPDRWPSIRKWWLEPGGEVT